MLSAGWVLQPVQLVRHAVPQEPVDAREALIDGTRRLPQLAGYHLARQPVGVLHAQQFPGSGCKFLDAAVQDLHLVHRSGLARPLLFLQIEHLIGGAAKGSAYEKAASLRGSVSGPGNASTSKDYLKQYGKKRAA